MSETPSAAGVAAPPKRTKDTLKKAPLTIEDLPAGFSVVPAADDQAGGGQISSKDPRCKDLVEIMNADGAPGALASAPQGRSPEGRTGPGSMSTSTPSPARTL